MGPEFPIQVQGAILAVSELRVKEQVAVSFFRGGGLENTAQITMAKHGSLMKHVIRRSMGRGGEVRRWGREGRSRHWEPLKLPRDGSQSLARA